jgi:hypothetical protein
VSSIAYATVSIAASISCATPAGAGVTFHGLFVTKLLNACSCAPDRRLSLPVRTFLGRCGARLARLKQTKAFDPRLRSIGGTTTGQADHVPGNSRAAWTTKLPRGLHVDGSSLSTNHLPETSRGIDQRHTDNLITATSAHFGARWCDRRRCAALLRGPFTRRGGRRSALVDAELPE